MVMKREDIVKALGCLEMKGGMHQLSEELRSAISAALSDCVIKALSAEAAAAEKPKRGRPPLNKGAKPQ